MNGELFGEDLFWVWFNQEGKAVSKQFDSFDEAIVTKTAYCDCSVEKLYELGLKLCLVRVEYKHVFAIEKIGE